MLFKRSAKGLASIGVDQPLVSNEQLIRRRTQLQRRSQNLLQVL